MNQLTRISKNIFNSVSLYFPAIPMEGGIDAETFLLQHRDGNGTASFTHHQSGNGGQLPLLIKEGVRGRLSMNTIAFKAGYGVNMSDILNDCRVKAKRKYLRSNPTTAEKILWGRLSNKKFCGLKFRRQYSVNNYIIDFYCPQFKLALELYGTVHGYNCRIKKDRKRIAEIESAGIKVLVITNQQVIENPDGVLEYIQSNLPPAPSFIRRGSRCNDHANSPKRSRSDDHANSPRGSRCDDFTTLRNESRSDDSNFVDSKSRCDDSASLLKRHQYDGIARNRKYAKKKLRETPES